MNRSFSLLLLCLFTGKIADCYGQVTDTNIHIIKPVDLRHVKINDAFWSPRYKVWTTVTAYDVFDKLEGKYIPDLQKRRVELKVRA